MNSLFVKLSRALTKEIQQKLEQLIEESRRREETLAAGLQQKLEQLAEESRRREETLAAGLQQKLEQLAEESRRREETLAAGLQQRLEQVIEESRRREDRLTAEIQRKFDKMMQEAKDREGNLGDLAQRSYKKAKISHKELQNLRKELQSSRELLLRQGSGENNAPPDFADLARICSEHLVPLHEPLVLISQAPRSGGTLLSQLFDGHPECHTHPYELYIGYPDKNQWPVLDLHDSPQRWFEILFETRSDQLFREGYQKYSKGRDEKPETFPFIFLPSLQKELFFKCLANGTVTSLRQVLDAYMTSYFNAWLNNQNMSGRKKIIVAFTARLAMYEDSVERFFSVYPDGKLISILRKPQGWYGSARKGLASVQRASLKEAMDLWRTSTEALLRNKRNYQERVSLVRFEDLVEKTEPVMRYLADYVGIEFGKVLLTPTFNKRLIKANSSYPVETYGVIDEPVARYAELLSQAKINAMDELVGELYEKALKEAINIS